MSAEKTVIRDTHIHEEKHDGGSVSSESDLGEKKKKTGVIQNIKHGIKNVVDNIAGRDKHDATCDKTTCVTSEQQTLHSTEVDEHARNARILREQGEATLKMNNKEFAEAQRAQNTARMVAENANIKTAEALQHQEHGQKLLAEAGAQMIEAGAKLQREASAVQHTVPYNQHQEGEVRQTTIVNAAGQTAAAHAHEAVTIREVEHTDVQ